jgi:hypothetical protein
MAGLALALPAHALAEGPAVAPAADPAAVAVPHDDLAARVRALEGVIEGMQEQVQTMQGDVDKARKFKFSGYVQARWETGETKRDSVRVSGSGPTLAPANTERFNIRRGRLKLTYDSSPLSQAVVYLDGASSGSSINVRLLEATVTLLDPWTVLHRHALTIGQMNVPFGYELERSSASRELPERSRAENVLFPGERDRGVKLVSQWSPQIETVVGVFNGPGISSADYPTADPDRAKDLVARVRWSQGTVDAAVSVLNGRQLTALTGPDAVTDKRRVGVDAQVYYQTPVLGGGSIKAEWYGGHEVNPDSIRALVTAGAAPRLLVPGADSGHLATDVAGGYLMAVQNLGERFQAAARYDEWDPNTGREHDQYSRWSLAAHWFYDGFTRVTVAYDAPATEVRAGNRYDDPKDNLWTVQVQHRF